MSEPSSNLFPKIFGHLPSLIQALLAYPINRKEAPAELLEYFSQAFEDGFSPSDVFRALSEMTVDAGDQNRESVFLAIAYSKIGPVQFESFFQDWLHHSEDLLGKVGSPKRYPAFNEVETAVMAKRGISLVRRPDGSLRPVEELQSFAGTRAQVFSFIHSALLLDDLEGLDHLESIPGMAQYFDQEELVELVDAFVHYSRDFEGNGAEHFEGLAPIPNVMARFYIVRPMRDYWLAITGAISKGSVAALEASFDSNLSLKGGSDLVLEILQDKTIREPLQRKVAIAYLVKHIGAGANMFDAFHVIQHGRVAAKDFAGSPVPLDAVVRLALSQDASDEEPFELFLLMYTTDQILEHDRGQDCFKLLYSLTGDLKYMACIESMEYRGKAFLNELGI